jgi:hypothetical protein
VQVQSTRSIYQSTSWAQLSRALIIYPSRRFRSLGAGLLSNLFQILGFWSAVRQFKDSRSQEGLPCRRVYMINCSRYSIKPSHGLLCLEFVCADKSFDIDVVLVSRIGRA